MGSGFGEGAQQPFGLVDAKKDFVHLALARQRGQPRARGQCQAQVGAAHADQAQAALGACGCRAAVQAGRDDGTARHDDVVDEAVARCSVVASSATGRQRVARASAHRNSAP